MAKATDTLMRARAELEPLLTVGDLARQWGRDYYAVRRLVRALWEQDLEADRRHPRKEPRADWMVRARQRGGRDRINYARLLVRHPALARPRRVAREEVEALADRVEQLERKVADLLKRANAHGAAIRDLGRRGNGGA